MTRDEWLKTFAGEYRSLDSKASEDAVAKIAQQCYYPDLNPRLAARRWVRINPSPLTVSQEAESGLAYKNRG